MRPLFLFLIALLNFWPLFWLQEKPVARAAEESFLTVSGVQALAPSDKPLVLAGIRILPGATLTVAEGTVVYLLPGASVMVEGGLFALGTAAAPISFTCAGTCNWKGLVSTGTAQTHLHWVTLAGFTEPVTLFDPVTDLGDLTLKDGIHNQLILGEQDRTYPDVGELGELVFSNRTAGPEMQESGLVVRGKRGGIRLHGIRFEDGRSQAIQPPSQDRVEFQGDIGQWVVESLLFPRQCRSRTEVSFAAGHNTYALVPDLSTCKDRPRPVVFVPGFGASVNLPLLTSLDLGQTELSGWTFMKKLSPAYFSFLEDLDLRGIPYLVAYYDWRLPADQAARRYLEPAIAEAKRRFEVADVNVVAHSYGGLVSRSYIQGESYRGDVANLIELGTPNAGAAEAYSVWEGGELGMDWEQAVHLVRFYAFQRALQGAGLSWLETLRSSVPGLADLMPVYPFLTRGQGWLDPGSLALANRALLKLNADYSRLLGRTNVRTLVSSATATLRGLKVNSGSPGSQWPDGKPILSYYSSGDGTVPQESASLPGLAAISVSGKHNELPETAAAKVFSLLYPGLPAAPLVTTKAPSWLSLLLDCPVEVRVELPDGRAFLSTDAIPPPDVQVLEGGGLHWLLLPKEEGRYGLVIRSLSSGPVRWWVEDGAIERVDLGQDQELRRGFTVDKSGKVKLDNALGPLPTAEPTPALAAPLAPPSAGQELSLGKVELSEDSLKDSLLLSQLMTEVRLLPVLGGSSTTAGYSHGRSSSYDASGRLHPRVGIKRGLIICLIALVFAILVVTSILVVRKGKFWENQTNLRPTRQRKPP